MRFTFIINKLEHSTNSSVWKWGICDWVYDKIKYTNCCFLCCENRTCRRKRKRASTVLKQLPYCVRVFLLRDLNAMKSTDKNKYSCKCCCSTIFQRIAKNVPKLTLYYWNYSRVPGWWHTMVHLTHIFNTINNDNNNNKIIIRNFD